MKKLSFILIILLPLIADGQEDLSGPSLTKVFTNDLYYYPAIINNALFRDKGEISISAFLVCSYGINAAWSPGKHVAVYGNYGMTPRDKHRLHTYGAGVGYCGCFGRKKYWTYNVNANISNCEANIQLKDTDLKEKLNSYSCFINGEFGFRYEYIETAISTGFSFFNFYGYQDLNGDANHKWLYGEYLNGKSGTVFLPGIITRGGPHYLKIGTQLFIPVIFDDTKWKVNFYDRIIFLVTLSVRFEVGKK